jgi:hypothetical protein
MITMQLKNIIFHVLYTNFNLQKHLSYAETNINMQNVSIRATVGENGCPSITKT